MGSAEPVTLARQRDLSSSGVSWGAVIAGASVASALSLTMLALCAGFELSVISPWSSLRASPASLSTVGLICLVITQVIAFAMGGYLVGRLRNRWDSLHNDEVHFRDTANGFLTWAVTVVLTVAFLTSAATRMAGGVADSPGASLRNTPAEMESDLGANAYFVDRLFRPDHPGASEADVVARAEAGRIIDAALRQQEGATLDADYLVQLVVANSGLNQNAAQRRVAETLAEARQNLDRVRKGTARILLWTFLTLLIGAFCASFAATLGGRQRDHVQTL